MKLYSQRERIKENKDLYEYNYIPESFLNSIISRMVYLYDIDPDIFIVSDNHHRYFWNSIARILTEQGGYSFGKENNRYVPNTLVIDTLRSKIRESNQYKNTCHFFLDFIEAFLFKISDYYKECFIQFLNDKFREHGLGYQYNDGEIIKISDTHIYQEVTAPALEILRNPKYELVNEEYRTAFNHLKNDHFKDCITSCARALETFLKLIFNEKNWPYSQTATLKTLLEVATKHTLFPTHLAGTLEHIIQNTGGIRNKSGGHGSDSKTEEPSLELAEYVLHLTASHIIFLDKISGI